MPLSATQARLLPSISKGLVTTATVRMPSSCATCATTGAAPVPVPPPPPTPITLITALWLYASISSNMVLLLTQIQRLVESLFALSSLLALSASKVALEPRTHALEHRLAVPAEGTPAMHRQHVVARVEQQPHAGGKDRVAHHLGEAPHALRDAETHRHVEHLLGELDRAFHLGAATGEHDAGGDHFLQAAAPQLLVHESEQLLVARLDDLGERLARETARGALADARHLDALVGVGELRQRAGVADLDVLGILGRCAHRDRDVVGDLVAGDRDDRGVTDRPAREHREVRGAAADVDETDSELLLVLGEDREAGRELLEHHVIHVEPAALDALLDVL